MTLDQLKTAHPALAALLLEACSKRAALAAHLVAEVTAIAEAGATASERERAVAHLTLGERGDMRLAVEAVESGALLEQGICDRHMAAAVARRSNKLSLVKGDKSWP